MAKSSQYCARVIDKEELTDWRNLRREQALFDLDALRATLKSCPLSFPASRPRLLFGEADVARIRQRADAATRERIRQECDKLIADPPDNVESRNASYLARPVRIVAGGFLLLQDERYLEWARRRSEALLTLPSWMGAVHKSFIKHCDHVMANVGADLSCAHDWLGDAVDDAFTDRLADGLRQLLLLPYLEGARKRDEHWSRDTYLANWKIMTFGESGLAICAFGDRWPEAREGLALSADGVLDILDVIPPEGDWPEGLGYWYATLFMGLRFGLALRRLTGGKADLLAHPRLAVTGDFGAAHISPQGRVYNYGDNSDVLAPHCAEALLILANEQARPDWRAAARHFPSYSPLWLHFDDPETAGTPIADGTSAFPATGVVILRRGSTFVGMRSGDSTVGHAHLDCNGFILETRGASLIRDSGLWPYAHFLGFFDCGKGYGGKRWNFDALATVGHSVVLVDGLGQACGSEYAGRIEVPVCGDGWMRLDADASNCYPGLLTKWRRSLLLVGEELLVVRDVIVCDGERHMEWLLHSDAAFCDDGDDTVLELNGVRARLVPLLPDRSQGWRVSDVTHRSVYENSNTGEIERPAIRYRSFAPFCVAKAVEFLFILQLHADQPLPFAFSGTSADWQLNLSGSDQTIIPDGDTMTVRVAAQPVSPD